MAKLNRRGFVKASSAAVAVCAAGEFARVAAGADDQVSFDVGRQIYKSLKWGMIRTDGSTLEKFTMLKELGYDGIELDSPEGVDKQEALRASRETGLPIEGIVNSTPLANPTLRSGPGSSCPGTREHAYGPWLCQVCRRRLGLARARQGYRSEN